MTPLPVCMPIGAGRRDSILYTVEFDLWVTIECLVNICELWSGAEMWRKKDVNFCVTTLGLDALASRSL